MVLSKQGHMAGVLLAILHFQDVEVGALRFIGWSPRVLVVAAGEYFIAPTVEHLELGVLIVFHPFEIQRIVLVIVVRAEDVRDNDLRRNYRLNERERVTTAISRGNG